MDTAKAANIRLQNILDFNKHMGIEVIKYRLPVYWAGALINDDYTGLSDEEEQEIDDFIKHADGYPVGVEWKTEGFYHYNDANAIAGNCVDFIFHKLT